MRVEAVRSTVESVGKIFMQKYVLFFLLIFMIDSCQASFFYTSQQGMVLRCLVDDETGKLDDCKYTGSGFSDPEGLDRSPDGRFLYVANNQNHTVSACHVNELTGELFSCTRMGDHFSIPSSIAVNAAGNFVYITNYNGFSVTLCAIENGALHDCKPIDKRMCGPSDIKLRDNTAYITTEDTEFMMICTIDPLSGDFTECTEVSTGFNGPTSVALSPNGSMVYIANHKNNTVRMCKLDNNQLTQCKLLPIVYTGLGKIVVTQNFVYIPTTEKIYQCLIKEERIGSCV